MSFAKSTFLSFCVTGLKLLNGFFLVKLISVYVGPEGLARMGQFHSFIYLLVLLAGGGINQGIIKYISEYKNDSKELKEIIGCGQSILLTTTCLSFFLIIFFRNDLSILLFGNNGYSYIIIITAFGQIFMSMSNFFTSIINGFKEISKISIINFLGILIGALTSYTLVIKYNFEGILVAYIFSQSFLFLFAFYFLFKIKGFRFFYFYPKFNTHAILSLFKFSFMTITSAVLTNIAQFIIRNHLANELTWEKVGYWEGVVKISDAYIILITTALSVYCLPTLSAMSGKTKITNELLIIFKIILPITFVLALSIFIFRGHIINILFSDKFTPMKDLFLWQLVGDIMRVSGMVFAYFLLSKAFIKVFVFIEFFCSLLYLTLVYLLTKEFGLDGSIYAFCINACVFMIITFYCTMKKLSRFSED